MKYYIARSDFEYTVKHGFDEDLYYLDKRQWTMFEIHPFSLCPVIMASDYEYVNDKLVKVK